MKASSRYQRVLRAAKLITLTFLVIAALVGTSVQVDAKPKFMLVYFDGHMHTSRSDGTGTVADIKATALSRGLDAVIVTDHCNYLTKAEWDSLVAESAAASDGNFLVLPGFEVTGSEGFFNRDHFNAFGISDPFVGDETDELCPEEVWESPTNPDGTGPMYPENLTKWVDFIHSQGGLVVHNHPSGVTKHDYGVKHLEVYNQSTIDDIAGYATALGYDPVLAWQLGLTFNNFAIYGERDVNMLVPFPGFPTPIPLRIGLWYASEYYIPPNIGQWVGSPEVPLNSWDDLLLEYVNGAAETPIFGLANSDAHNTGDPASIVGTAKNGVYVKELTERELLKAIKAGRSFATTGPSLEFSVNGELMGDTARITDGTGMIDLSVSSESPTAILVKIDIIKNGQPWNTFSPFSPVYSDRLADDSITEDGYYRVEVTSVDLIDGSYHFAWSNPVFVTLE